MTKNQKIEAQFQKKIRLLKRDNYLLKKAIDILKHENQRLKDDREFLQKEIQLMEENAAEENL